MYRGRARAVVLAGDWHHPTLLCPPVVSNFCRVSNWRALGLNGSTSTSVICSSPNTSARVSLINYIIASFLQDHDSLSHHSVPPSIARSVLYFYKVIATKRRAVWRPWGTSYGRWDKSYRVFLSSSPRQWRGHVKITITISGYLSLVAHLVPTVTVSGPKCRCQNNASQIFFVRLSTMNCANWVLTTVLRP